MVLDADELVAAGGGKDVEPGEGGGARTPSCMMLPRNCPALMAAAAPQGCSSVEERAAVDEQAHARDGASAVAVDRAAHEPGGVVGEEGVGDAGAGILEENGAAVVGAGIAQELDAQI